MRTGLCECGHAVSNHVDTMEDADGFFFVYCDYCECLVEQSQFDV